MNVGRSIDSLNAAGPVAIGGVGGSGTRVVAEVLKALGIFIGQDLNEAQDNLWFTALFKYRELLALENQEFALRYGLFRERMTSGLPQVLAPDLIARLLASDRAGQHDQDWLLARCETLQQGGGAGVGPHWGWKEPNTHMVIDRIAGLEPRVRYIHVVRNGLDMSLSSNQNQLRLWGPLVLKERFEDSPRGSLAFWRFAHERIARIGAALGTRYLLVNFDALCSDTEGQLHRLLDFVQIKASAATLERLGAGIKVPPTVNRGKALPLDHFHQDDLAFVRSMGFSVD